ncbi:hypothetical protein F5887DRAFT_1256971, partial [Amanita rubescens]
MSDREQTWSRELQDLFDYSPPAVEQVEDTATYRLPFTFFDRHIDPRLSLKRVILVPSFTADIAQVIDRAVQTTKDEGGLLPLIDYKDDEDMSALFTKRGRNWGVVRGNKLTDASSVARFYEEVSFIYCSPVGTTFGLSPHSYTWLNIFRFDKAGEEPDEGRSAITNQYSIEIDRDRDTGTMRIPRGVWKFLNEESRTDLTDASARFRRLVTYQFYAATTEYDEVLEKMGDICSKESVAAWPDSVSGFPLQDLPLVPLVDSTVLPWSARDEPLKQGEDEPATRSQNNTPSQGITVKKSNTHLDDIITFVKHVNPLWTIPLLSSSIAASMNVLDCRDPRYSKIQAGVYLLVIRDFMERARAFRKLAQKSSILEGKAQGQSDESRQIKRRPKTRSVTTSVEKEKALIFRECDSRDLALLQIRHMPLNSPSPAAFIRRGCGISPGIPCASNDKWKSQIESRAQEYQVHEYFELLLKPNFDSGATGQVHKATLRMALADGRLLSSPATIKVAFHDLQRERLRNEYVVYKYLAKNGVKCVATIFGLFEDINGESSALIMSDAGISLHGREKKRNPGKAPVEQVSVSREERDAFKQALSEIHRAGVRHYDIRPMNLLIDDEGEATIIDFDMAKIGAGKHSRKREFDDLCSLLQGSYYPPNQFPSSPTTQSSRAESDFLKDP